MCYSAAFTASNGKLDLPGSLLLYSQLVWLTYDLSRGNCVGGATHSRLCVPYFYPLRCPLELCSVSIAYHSMREMYCIPYISSYIRTESSVGWKRSYHAFENFSPSFIFNPFTIVPSEKRRKKDNDS